MMTVGVYSLVSGLCLFGVMVLYLRMKNGAAPSEKKDIYVGLMLASLIYLAEDCLWGVIYDELLPIPIVMQRVIYAFYYSGSAVLSYYWFYYVEFMQDACFYRNRLVRNVARIPMILVIVTSVISIWTGWMFYIDDQGAYCRGVLYIPQLICTYGYILVSAIKVMVKMFITRDFEKQNTYLIMLSHFIFPVVFGVQQVMNPEKPFLCIGIAMASLQTYLFNVNFEEERERSATKIHSLTRLFISSYYMDIQTGRREQLSEEVGRVHEYRTGDFYMNAPAEHDEAMRVYAENFVHREDKARFIQCCSRNYIRKHLSQDEMFYYFDFRQVAGGEERWYRMHIIAASFDGEGEASNAVLSVMDVDKQIRNKIRQKEALEEALEQAEQANAAKSTFLSNMSHDIRTPMNAIMGFAQLAKNSGEDTQQVKEYLDKIHNAGLHLLSLINDILDMSRIESGKLKIEENEVALSEIVKSVSDMIAPMAEENQLTYQTDIDVEDAYVYCDKLRLNQVLINLLGNAIKFTPAGGSVALSIIQEPNGPEGYGVYSFKVRDTGMGIAPEFMDKVFQAFERHQNSTISGIQGTGLGLSITKSIVELMGGKISVTSKVNEGTEFVVKLVFTLQDVQDEDESMQQQIQLRKQEAQELLRQRKELFSGKRILLVEDHPLNREIARTLLTEEGFLVEEAENGQEAVDKMKEADGDTYAVILMDIQMPVMDGYEATKQIRQLPDKSVATVPIVAMTANAFAEERQKALQDGMNGHVSKPIDTEVLFGALQQIIKANS